MKAAKNYIKLAKKFHRGSAVLYTSSGAIYGNQSYSDGKFTEKHSLQSQQIINLKLEKSMQRLNIKMRNCLRI